MKIALFAGTYEGRIIATFLGKANINTDVFTATLYAQELLDKYDNMKIFSKRVDKNEMEEIFKNNKYDLILDATHPYATIVTKNIKEVSEKLNIKYLRVIRNLDYDGKIYSNYDEIIRILNENDDNILLTIGSKELHHFVKVNNYQKRIYLRILPMIESLDIANKLGFETSHIIAMQGPFSKEMNISQIKEYNIKYVISKLTGSSGGFMEKLEACNETSTNFIVAASEEIKINNQGLSLKETLQYLKEELNIVINKDIYILGMGMNIKTLTKEIEQTISNCDLIIGSNRLIETFHDLIRNKEIIKEYKADKIKEIVDSTIYEKIAILVSGDTGFYSAAPSIRNVLKSYKVHTICGISSFAYFASKVGLSYEKMVLLSLHGRNDNLIYYVNRNQYVFTLLDNNNGIEEVLNRLKKYQLLNCKIYIGEDLGTVQERITIGLAKELINKKIEYNSLAVMIIQNDDYLKDINYKHNDDCFIKDVTPMTKEEIRTLSISKLDLNIDSIVYDIGAGTGSVGLEIAGKVINGHVYLIEKNPDAKPAIEQNIINLRIDNTTLIIGQAPECLNDLPTPTHVFIGGSSGNIQNIIKLILNKNENVKIVVNAVTLETISELVNIIKEENLDSEIISVNVAKNKQIASYNLMNAQNPIYIFTLQKK